ncbi:putative Dipeptide transport system permease protein DppB [Hollandina sp. SP2]
MLGYVLKRLLHFIPVFLGVTLLGFALLRLAPGDAARLRLVARGLDPSPEALRELREALGLNRPLGEQYLRWLWDIGRLDFGRSVVTGKPVLTEYLVHLKASAALGFPTLLFSAGIAFPAGILSAMFKGRVLEQPQLYQKFC